jgi:hypothetical protein
MGAAAGLRSRRIGHLNRSTRFSAAHPQTHGCLPALLARDDRLDHVAVLVLQSRLHSLQQIRRQLDIVTVLGHALNQVTLRADHLLRAGNVPLRLDEMLCSIPLSAVMSASWH